MKIDHGAYDAGLILGAWPIPRRTICFGPAGCSSQQNKYEEGKKSTTAELLAGHISYRSRASLWRKVSPAADTPPLNRCVTKSLIESCAGASTASAQHSERLWSRLDTAGAHCACQKATRNDSVVPKCSIGWFARPPPHSCGEG